MNRRIVSMAFAATSARRAARAAALCVVLAHCARPAPPNPASLVLRGGKVATMDDARPEAQAIAIAGHTILAVGTDLEIDRHIGPATRVIELDGRLAIPGLIEGHGHFMDLGRAKLLASAALESARTARVDADVKAVRRRMVELAGAEALAKGITSFHDAGADFETIDFFKQLEAQGKLPIRLYVMVRGETNPELAEKLASYRLIAEGNGFLAVRSIKRQIDGTIRSHDAWLLEPYVDLPTSRGPVLETPEDLEATARIAIEQGYQLSTHAIGDRANREVLDVYERVFRANPGKTDLRWRIEHAQHLHSDDVARFASLGVIASIQGVHVTSDALLIPRRLGDARARAGAFVWRALLSAGVMIANGTDVPVEDIDPVASFYATVSRRTRDGSVFYPEQRLTREEALRTCTLNNAIAAFEEGLKGSIAPGKLADIVVLSQDILTIPEEQILGTRVDYTILGGVVRYERGVTGLAARSLRPARD